MNLSPNNINGSLPHVPVTLEGNPANPPVQPIQEVPVQQVLPDIENPVIPVEVPAGISPIGPTWLEEISTEPFTLEKAIKVFEELRDIDPISLSFGENQAWHQNLLNLIQYVINNYPEDILSNEAFLGKIRGLLNTNEPCDPSQFSLLGTDILLSFFQRVDCLEIMNQQAWENYFENAFLDCIDYLLEVSLGEETQPHRGTFCGDKVKLFLILFGANKDYCEKVFGEIYDKNKDDQKFKELFAQSEKSEEEFKSYLKEEIFGSNTLFYAWTKGCNNAKSYNEFLDEKAKGLPHPFFSHRNVKSARNIAPQIIEVNHTTSNDDGKPTEGKKEEKKESSE